jgi:hypothetical protein
MLEIAGLPFASSWIALDMRLLSSFYIHAESRRLDYCFVMSDCMGHMTVLACTSMLGLSEIFLLLRTGHLNDG